MNSEHIKRIARVKKYLKEGEGLLLFASSGVKRNSDVEYKFRQDSSFYYLTGFAEADAILFITKKKTVMFVLAKDREKEIWTGIRTGRINIKKILQLDESYDVNDWQIQKQNLLSSIHTLFYFFGENELRDREILQSITTIARGIRDGRTAPVRIERPLFLHEMRLFKTEFEIKKIREAANITNIGHRLAMQEAKPGKREFEIEALLEKTYLEMGAWGGGYGHIVASGINATILHYTSNSAVMQEGDLLLIDSGAEKDYYTADVTRTFPVGKKFSQAQKEIYTIVLHAQKQAISTAKAGARLLDLHQITLKYLIEGLIKLKILQGSLASNLKSKAYNRFFMHKTSHWLGMDVHDVGNYFSAGESRKLTNGMVFTVEPGLYFAASDRTVPAKYRGIGIRIEDNILVNGNNPVNLTEMIPKEIEEIENLKK